MDKIQVLARKLGWKSQAERFAEKLTGLEKIEDILAQTKTARDNGLVQAEEMAMERLGQIGVGQVPLFDIFEIHYKMEQYGMNDMAGLLWGWIKDSDDFRLWFDVKEWLERQFRHQQIFYIVESLWEKERNFRRPMPMGMTLMALGRDGPIWCNLINTAKSYEDWVKLISRFGVNPEDIVFVRQKLLELEIDDPMKVVWIYDFIWRNHDVSDPILPVLMEKIVELMAISQAGKQKWNEWIRYAKTPELKASLISVYRANLKTREEELKNGNLIGIG